MRKFFLLQTLIIFSFLFFANIVLSAECTEGDCCDGENFLSSDTPCDAWTETACAWGTGRGSDVGERVITQYCSGGSANCDGSIEPSDWSVPPGGDCQSWEECSPSTYSCICNGAYLETPSNLSPLNGEENVELPVTLGWDTVNGAKSYRYRIDGVLENATSSTNVPIDEAGTCLLKSGTNYTWGVRACCGINGDDCGSWGNWNFKTSLAPQYVSPKNNTENVSMPVILDWCDVSGAKDYTMRIYINGLCHPYFLNPDTGECEFFPIPKEQRTGEATSILHSDYTDTTDFFTKNNRYDVEFATCLNEEAVDCSDYGKKWGFFTGPGSLLGAPQLKNPLYNPAEPSNVPSVNQSDSLVWQGGAGTLSYQIVIKKEGIAVANPKTNNEYLSLKNIPEIWDNPADFNAVYSWQVQPCWDRDGNNCEAAESAEWKFKTTGVPPSLNSPANGTNVKIPVNLTWENISKAASYYYEMAADDSFTTIQKNGTTSGPTATINYPDINLNTQYWWRVKTCANDKGSVCDGWSEVRSFRTYPLNPPTNPQPLTGFLPITLRWTPDAGANFYQYKVAYAQKSPEELSPTCAAKEGQQIIPAAGGEPPVINQASFSLNEFCLGEYQWRVRSCLSKDCSVATDWAESPVWIFNSLKPAVFEEKGITPCGRTDGADILSTPWDEREPCQLKHLGYMLQNILDFLLWRLGLIIMAILTVVSGVTSYFSLGSPNAFVQVKSIWKSAGLGWSIMLLAWIFINLIMRLTGFQVEFFGRWWQLPF